MNKNHLMAYICQNCGKSFLFALDSEDHRAETGHELFTVMEIERYLHIVDNCEAITAANASGCNNNNSNKFNPVRDDSSNNSSNRH